MEFLLLWIDDLDDALAAMRHLGPKILSFIVAIAVAIGLFVGTGYVLSLAPQVTLFVAALAASATLIEALRRRLERAPLRRR